MIQNAISAHKVFLSRWTSLTCEPRRMWSASLGGSRGALSESLRRVRQMLRRWPRSHIMWFKAFLSSIPGCWFWLGPLWQDRHRDSNPKRGCWRSPHWSCWCHRSGLRDDHHLFVSYQISFFAFQTDQRIVFQNSKAVRFSNSEEKVPARKKSSASQTRWELKDKEVQVVLASSQFWRKKMILITFFDYLNPF